MSADPTLPVQTVAPGDLVILECPQGAVSPIKSGERLPLGVPPDQSVAVVVATDGHKISLGPLKSGESSIELPCAAESPLRMTWNVLEVKAESASKRENPLSPESMAFPVWIWGVLGILLLGILLFVGVRRSLRRQRARRSAKKTGAGVLSPPERLDHLLSEAKKGRVGENTEALMAQKLYSEGYECLRSYLEHRLHFAAPEATSREFMGALKTAVIRRNTESRSSAASSPPPQVNSELLGVVEALMSQGDLIRFSGGNASPEARVGFLKGLAQVRAGI